MVDIHTYTSDLCFSVAVALTTGSPSICWLTWLSSVIRRTKRRTDNHVILIDSWPQRFHPLIPISFRISKAPGLSDSPFLQSSVFNSFASHLVLAESRQANAGTSWVFYEWRFEQSTAQTLEQLTYEARSNRQRFVLPRFLKPGSGAHECGLE